MEHSLDERRSVLCVTVRGDVDLSTTPRLRRAFLDLDSAGHHHIDVDLERVEFLDSAGIGVLIGALRRARRAGGNLTVSAISPEVADVFSLLGLNLVFAVTSPADNSQAGARASAPPP